MIIYRVFDGDSYTHFGKMREATDAADRLAEEENCGPNGFVIVDKLTLPDENVMGHKSLVLATLNRESTVIGLDRIYERMAR